MAYDMTNRNTPHSITGVEPSVLMMGRRARSALSLLHPFHSSKHRAKALKHEQKVIDHESSSRQFAVGDKVRFWDENHKTWTKGFVQELDGAKVIHIRTTNGLVRKHLDHVVKSYENIDKESGISPLPAPEFQGDSVPAAAGNSMTHIGENLSTPRRGEPVGIEADLMPSYSYDSPANLSNPKLTVTPNPTTSPDPQNLVVPEMPRPKRKINPPDRLTYSKLGGE